MNHLRFVANGLEHHAIAWERDAALSPTGGTVVLVHGYMDAAGTWDRVGASLAATGARIVALDVRGFGDSARAPRGSYYHFSDCVFDLADVLDVVAPTERVMLVGHSMGGTIATLFAGTFPERVAKLAVLEGLGPPDNGWDAGPARMRAWIEQVRSLRARAPALPTFTRDEARRRLGMNHVNVPAAVLDDVFAHLVRDVDGAPGRVTWKFDPLHKTTSPVPFFAKLFVEFARNVTAPVLFVSGGPTGFHPPDEDARLAAFRRVERVELDAAGHMMHWTRPAELAGALARFFAL